MSLPLDFYASRRGIFFISMVTTPWNARSVLTILNTVVRYTDLNSLIMYVVNQPHSPQDPLPHKGSEM